MFGSIARGRYFLNACSPLCHKVVMLLLMYPYGSTTKRKENNITMAARSNHVVITLPLWVDHQMQQDSVWAHALW